MNNTQLGYIPVKPVSFWPEGIVVEDTRSPWDICAMANEEWIEKSGLEIKAGSKVTSNGITFLIRGHAVFRAWHEPNGRYPAAIEGLIKNDTYTTWCDTPREFERALIGILNSRGVKLLVTNILIDSNKKKTHE